MDLLRQNYFFGRLFVFLLISSLIFPAQLAAAETNVDDELPDLVVTSLYIGSDAPSPGEGVVIKATIANKGTIGAEDIGESIFVDGDHLISRGEYSLSPGASITREFEWVASEGSHAIKWMVDPEAQIQESNEDNNFRTIEIHVEDSKIPDLTITRVFVDKDVYEPGETVIIKAEVKNQGTGLAEGVRDVLIVDERIVSDSDAYQLEPGQIVTRQFRWEAVAGTHTLGVAVDPGNRIEELNEDNNEKFVSVKIRDEQRNSAEILSIETDKETYKRGDSVNIEYSFKNTGELRLHLRLAINIIGPDGRYVFDSIAGGEEGYFLSPGQHVSGRLSWTIPQDTPAGIYRIEAILVDGENRELVYDTKKGEYSPSFHVGVAFPIRLASITSIGVENIGSISVSTVGLFEFPTRLSLAEGVYRIQAKAPEGYHFDHFSMRGGVSIVTDTDDPAKVGIAVNGEGSILVVFAKSAYFEVEVENQLLEVHPGGSASTVVFIVPTTEYSGFVNLKLDTSGHLPISEYIFEPEYISLTNDGARSNLLVRIDDSAEPGDYAIKIIAKSGDFTSFGLIKLKVIAPEGILIVLPLEPSNNQVVEELPITLKVQVLNSDTNSPIQGAKVAFFVKGFADEWITRSDSSGYANVIISDISPGEYGWIAKAVKDGFNLGSSRVHVFNIISEVKKVQLPQLDVPFEGKFTHEDEVHQYSFEFEEGKTYLIRTLELDGVDTVIALTTEKGAKIAKDDDSGEGLASKIVFTATHSGTYFLEIREYWETKEGNYILLVTEAITATLTINIEHTYIGDLEIWVGVEGGREVKIWNRDGGSTDDVTKSWNLGTLGFTIDDLPPSEDQMWYLRVRDNASHDEGKILQFTIEYDGKTYSFTGVQEIMDFQESLVRISN